ncbi:hypothetical protein [Natrinema sp. SYSU A 869]|uniref:hypothetical protein n=1 Tax=Natrinema sp. SYSU A 869 TaxID=2871694 RepID=UPI002103D71E|nr:hypothetical protein [Natrinema sp. SYSU A 869]
MTGFGGALAVGLAHGVPFGRSDSNDGTDQRNESGDSEPSSGVTHPTPSPASLQNPSFEEYLTGWSVGTDLPTAPGESIDSVEHSVAITSERAADSEHSMALFIDGVADDGTIWVEQPVNITPVDTVTVDVYSQQESFNRMSQVAFFAGKKPRDGLSERDFNREKDIEDHAGWKTYSYSVSDLEGVVTLAIGMNVVWETGVRRFFDDIRLVTE